MVNQVVNAQLTSKQKDLLTATFGDRVQRSVSLARYTAARIGGAADWLLMVECEADLVDSVTHLWRLDIPFTVLGGGSNVLVSDNGVRQLVILNKAKDLQYDLENSPPTVLAESGANFGLMARQCASRGLKGLEWAAGVPGTVGGAVFGNAGAHGGEVARSLQLAEILHRKVHGIVRESWSLNDFEFQYRSSVLKRIPSDTVILSARFELQFGDPDEILSQMEQYATFRRKTQPPGASMGSIFKNPNGDFAGRLIEEAGLKGTRIGGAEISLVHANFIVNHEGASASDVSKLIQLAQKNVLERSDIELDLEIELIGDWD